MNLPFELRSLAPALALLQLLAACQPQTTNEITQEAKSEQARGDLDGVSYTLTRALAQTDLSPGQRVEVLTERGDAYLKLRRPADAITDFDAALALAPTSAGALEGRARTRAYGGDVDEAIADWSQLITQGTDSGEPYVERGDLYMQKSRQVSQSDSRDHVNMALADYNAALHVDPGFVRAYMARAQAYRANGDRADALQDLDRVIQLKPADPDAYTQRAANELADKDFNAAIADYTSLIGLDPRAVDPHLGLAEAYEESGRTVQAIQEYSAVKTMYPDNPKALQALSRLGDQSP